MVDRHPDTLQPVKMKSSKCVLSFIFGREMSRAVIQNTSVKEELLAQQGDGGGAEKEIKEREKKMEIFTQEVEIQDAGTAAITQV